MESFPEHPEIEQIPDQPKDGTAPREVKSGLFAGITELQLGGPNGLTMSGARGIFAGDDDPATAPFSVNLQGQLTATGVTIKDSLGTAVIDSTGLNSVNNFGSSSVQQSAAFSTTNTVYPGDLVPGMAVSFTLTRSTKMFFYVTVNGSSAIGFASLLFYLYRWNADRCRIKERGALR